MSVDDKVGRDPRITILAKLLGWSRRETLGCLVGDVWPICYDQECSIISARVVDAAADHDGFSEAMVEAELARRDRSGKLRINGAKERIEYLEHKKRAGREGGLKSGEVRALKPKHPSSSGGSTPQAAGNPPVPDPVPSPVPDPVPVPSQEEKNAAPPSLVLVPPSDIGRKRDRKRKPVDATSAELASVSVVLEKLSKANGVRYSGAPPHVRLIVARLRDGATEMDLRAVIGYCAFKQKWAEKPEMHGYLRPETLFGPDNFAKYLDPARTWFESLPADEPAQRRDSEAEPEWMQHGGVE